MLDSRRPDPVRGQLELFDGRAHGWYLQCTDIPAEMKVLLPYATGKLYRELLDIEAMELQKPETSWERVLEIRHLKDRMIRKCQRTFNYFPRRHLVETQDSKSIISFHTFAAPSDFRLREMEKWLRTNQEQQIIVDRTTSLKKALHTASYSTSDDTETTSQSTSSLPTIDQEKEQAQNNAMAEKSPSPLPHPYLSSIPEAQVHSDSELNDVVEPIRPSLSHRRSSIKRNSSGDVKTVSWAQRNDFSDQLKEYAKAAEDVKDAGRGWDNIRTACSDLDGLYSTVANSLDRMRTETEHLQAVQESIRAQRDRLQDTIARFEREEGEFREKVQTMLQVTEQTLTLCGTGT